MTDNGNGASGTRTPEDLRAEIAGTREALGETVEALAHKADVKARAHERVDHVRERISGKVHETRERVAGATPEQVTEGAGQAAARAREHPLPVVAAGAFAAGLLLGMLLRGRAARP